MSLVLIAQVRIHHFHHVPQFLNLTLYSEATGLSADYVSTETNLIFSSSINKACITIDILDNIQVEHLEEYFYVTLERVANTPGGVILTGNMAEVIIVDNDGKPLPKHV